jgi:hypothetical protein
MSDAKSVRRAAVRPRAIAGNCHPADEQRISEIERGLSCEAVVPLPPGGSLTAGDPLLFALSHSRAGQQPSYVKGGDSVQVSLTGVVDTGRVDPATGQALVRITWGPPGHSSTPAPTPDAP